MAHRGITKTTAHATTDEVAIDDYETNEGNGVAVFVFATIAGVLHISWLDANGEVRPCSATETVIAAGDTEIVNMVFRHPGFRLSFTPGDDAAGTITTEVVLYGVK